MAQYFIEHLPQDNVAYWDFDVPIQPGTYRDSSASAIALCGMLQLLEHLGDGDPDVPYFTAAVERAMASLIQNYATIGNPSAEGLLEHGSYYVRGGMGPDDYMIWGDYYYFEALMRLTKNIPGYWYDRTK